MSHSLIFPWSLSVCHSSCSLGMRDTICFSRCLVDTRLSIASLLLYYFGIVQYYFEPSIYHTQVGPFVSTIHLGLLKFLQGEYCNILGSSRQRGIIEVSHPRTGWLSMSSLSSSGISLLHLKLLLSTILSLPGL